MNAPTPPPGEPVIEMTGVTVGSLRNPGTAVVDAVDWTVRPGEFWIIAGQEGSGKSDLLLLAGGLTAPLGGRYRLFGEEMPIFDEARLATRLRLGLVFEGGQLFNQLTVRENITLPLRYHRNLSRAEAAREADALLEATELSPFAGSTPGMIGRPWRLRTALARALMLEPDALLVDNPLAGLDLRHLAWWLDFFGQLSRGHACLRKRPVTLVVTTANARPWQGRAGHFGVLGNRRFIASASWAELEAAGVDEEASVAQGSSPADEDLTRRQESEKKE